MFFRIVGVEMLVEHSRHYDFPFFRAFDLLLIHGTKDSNAMIRIPCYR